MNTGKINFKYTPEQIAVVKKMGSDNRSEALAAQEALAAILTEPVLKVIQSAPTIANLYKTFGYDLDQAPKIPLDIFFDVRRKNYLNVWSQSQPGSTATNFVQGISEMYVNTYRLDASASVNKNYLKAGQLDILAAIFERLSQEMIIKQDMSAVNVLFGALAGARIDGQASNTAVTNLQIIRSATAGVFQMDDFNTLMTKFDRINSAWNGGTPAVEQNGITDILGSPEFFSNIRSIAYNPINSRSGSVTSSGATSLAAPDSVREEIFRSAGVPSIFGVNLIKSYDFGIGKTYNTLFANYAGATAYLGTAGSGSAAFAPTTEQLVVGINANGTNLVRLRERNGAGSELSLVVDDTFTNRSEKAGWYSYTKDGYVSLDNRQMVGMLF